MKLENQVCTLEQAKKLKELGIVGYSLITVVDRSGGIFVLSLDIGDEYYPCYCAFTVAELGVMLPKDSQWSWPVNDTLQGWTCAVCISGYEGCTSDQEQGGTTEAEARAALLIHLLESGKVTAEEVNARLAAA